MVLDPQTGSYTNKDLMAGNLHPGVGESLLAGAANGATFGFGDELAGVAGQSPLTVTRGQATTEAARRDHPIASITGNAAGNIAMLAPAAPMAASVAGPSLAGQAATGVATGAALGALQGAGDANAGSRVQGAGVGGIVGAAAGFAAPFLAAGLRQGAQPVIAWLKAADITGVKQALGVGTDAAKIIKAHLASDDPKAAIAAMDRAGANSMIADSSPQASQLLDTTVAAGGPAQRIARDAVDSRAAAAGANLTAKMDTILGAPQGVKGAAVDIASRTALSRKAAYDAAYAAPIDYAAPEGAAIEAVLARVPTRTLTAAISEANDAMKEAGVSNKQIMATLHPDGTVAFTEMPNVQQLDYLKRALGSVADTAKDTFGRYTAEGVRANRLAGDLKDAVGGAVPEYNNAVRLGGDKIAEDKALEIGRKFMQPSVTREDVLAVMKGVSVEARMAAKTGMRTAFSEAMDNVKAVASDPNMDARQAMKAVKDFSSDANRAKAAAIMGQAQAATLFREFDQAASQLALRTAIARNSATAARTAGKAAMDAIISGGPLQAFKMGRIAEGTKGLIQILTKTTPADQVVKMQTVYAEVAKALTDKRGASAKMALQIVQKAIAGTPATEAQARLVAKSLALIAASGSYHTLQQIQNPPSGGTPAQ